MILAQINFKVDYTPLPPSCLAGRQARGEVMFYPPLSEDKPLPKTVREVSFLPRDEHGGNLRQESRDEKFSPFLDPRLRGDDNNHAETDILGQSDKGGCNLLHSLKKIFPIALIVIILGFSLLPQATLGTFFSDPLQLGKGAKGAEATVGILAIRVLTGVIAFVGVLCFIVFVYAGILWMTASGNEQQVQSAKNTMFYATIGLLVVFGSYVVLKTVFDAIVATFIPLPES